MNHNSVNMAPVSKKRNVSSAKAKQQIVKKAKIDLSSKVDGIIQSRKQANDIFDLFCALEVSSHTVTNTRGLASGSTSLKL